MRHMLCALAMGLAATATAATEPHPFTVHDLVAMERISDPQPSPDGLLVSFVVTTMDLEANRGRSDLWIATTAGDSVRRLTTDPAGDWSPRWLDSQTLYFLSSRSGSGQVWRISVTGGEARQVTELPLDVDSLKVGPDGSALYLGIATFPDCDAVECTSNRLKERENAKTSGLTFDHLLVRHWDRWKDGRRNHVFRVPLEEGGLKAGAPVDLMAGVDGDCPTIPWGGDEDYVISPDGRWLVYAAKVVNGSEEAWSTNFDLWAVATDGAGETRCLTTTNEAWDTAPVFSPDGTRLAYLAMQRPGYEADRFRVVVRGWPDGEPRVISESWDRSPGSIVWSTDGTRLYAAADNVGNHSIFSIDPEKGVVSALLTRHTNDSPRPLPGGRLLFAQDSLVSPVELYVLDSTNQAPRQITALNRERLAAIDFGTYEQISFIGAHDDEVFGYLIRPVGFDSSKRYPLVLLIHGGPQGSFDDHWHYRWNPEIYAAHGYVTLMIDFHGSTGYGQAFTDAITGDWGGAPYEDLMLGLDSILHPGADRPL
jgi:dipeptidyl aminopeptidase/acylaminoacyl peptidase